MRSRKIDRSLVVIELKREGSSSDYVRLAHRSLEKSQAGLEAGYTQRVFQVPVDYIRMTAPDGAVGVETLTLVYGEPS